MALGSASRVSQHARSMSTGISFLAFRRLKIYTHLRPCEYNFFSELTTEEQASKEKINSAKPSRSARFSNNALLLYGSRW